MEAAEALEIRSLPVAKTLVALQVVQPDKKAFWMDPTLLPEPG